MPDAVFVAGGQLRHALPRDFCWKEEGVISKAMGSCGRCRDASLAGTSPHLLSSSGHHSQGAHKTRAALRDAVQGTQELGVVRLGGGLRGVALGVHTGSTVESVHFQARVVCDTRQAGGLENEACFLKCVGLESGGSSSRAGGDDGG